MKKKLLITIGIIVVILIGVGGKVYMDSKKLEEKMIKVVKSAEAKQEFEEVLSNLDTKSLTPRGIIKSYMIDFTTIKHNPMGGINVTLIINKNKELTIEYTLNKVNGTLKAGGISYSGTLADLLEENDNE